MSKKYNLKSKMQSVRQATAKMKKVSEVEYGPIIVEEINRKEEKQDNKPYNNREQIENYKFEYNKKYITICLYALATIAVAGLIIYSIVNLPVIKSWLRGFFSILSPFISAFFIAFILNPLVRNLESKFFLDTCKIKSVKIRLSLSIFISYIAIISLFVIGLVYVIPQITKSIYDLTNRVPGMYDDIIRYLDNIEEYLSPNVIDFIEEKLSEVTPQLVSFGTDLVKNVFPVIFDVPVFIAKLTINIFLSIAISIYMLYDKRMLSKHATRIVYVMMNRKKAESFLKIMKECSKIFSSFIVGKSIDSLIIGIICFAVMSILKLPYAVLISVIVGITNMIPYFGPFIGAIPGVLLYLCLDPIKAVVFAIMVLVLQQFDGWILGPKILGDSTGLTPLWVIFGITVGGAYGGVLGMFLGVPIVAVVAYLSNLIITAKLKKKRLEIK